MLGLGLGSSQGWTQAQAAQPEDTRGQMGPQDATRGGREATPRSKSIDLLALKYTRLMLFTNEIRRSGSSKMQLLGALHE